MTKALHLLLRSGTITYTVLALSSAESFESLPAGPLKEARTSIGTWSADTGNAQIQPGHAKTGQQCLRLAGEGERTATLTLTEPAAKGTALTFHAERWTKRDPFRFRIDAKERDSWKEIKNADDTLTGAFKTEVRLDLPTGTSELRFRVTADTGVMIDDVTLHQPGPARAVLVETVQPVCPAFIREDYNPVLGFRIVVEGSEGTVKLEGLELGFTGTTDLTDITSFRIVTGTADPSADPGTTIAEGKKAEGKLSLTTKHELASGEHWFWISPTLKETASLDHRIDASLFRIKAGGKVLEPAQPSPDGTQRIGYAVRLPGDDHSKSYRIPGLVRTKSGTLVAVYDIRYDSSGDLPANIDVGVSRSIDRGQTWEPMRVAIDMGDDPKHGHDGVGDPAILFDPSNNRLWIAALWSHGNRAWGGSGPGMTPDETGQLVLVHSDDDGKTWSKPTNITTQVKDPTLRLFFNGPGAGIALKDGTLAFAAQYRAADGKPWSTMISSKDHGETWQAGTGVKSDTTESQLAQLADGSIMINCRDNRGGSRTIATTRDLGKTWTPHPTDRQALREPVCMASLLEWKDALWFSNPDATDTRRAMTLKRSTDQGLTWPEKDARLYDSRNGFGYSCLAPIDDSHLGVIYEGKSTMYFLRLPTTE
ncbi:sialidase family protein [Luteolibacter soli]|uniref:exo-alpha-sialidase n=1 Tax=Luteolibacter soli TaxID=3135280 RepID=A0ABU9AUL7_9BACT